MPPKKKSNTAVLDPPIPFVKGESEFRLSQTVSEAFKDVERALPEVHAAFKRALPEYRKNLDISLDPTLWCQENLGVDVYTNQSVVIETVINKDIDVNVLAVRGGGKSDAVVMAIIAYCILYPGLQVIVAGPKEKQAKRLLEKMEKYLTAKGSKVSNQVDWKKSQKTKMVFVNGSKVWALSAQERANVEGDHGHILVVDEAHKIPGYSITNKLIPMIGMLGISKIIKIGTSQGKNSHFYTSCTVNKEGTLKCPWNKAEIWVAHDKRRLFYKNKQISSVLLGRMPFTMKKKYYPDRPDFWTLTGNEVTQLDWETEYELNWVDDLLNFLSEADHTELGSGQHEILLQGKPGETYVFGLDTARGSLMGRPGTDRTVLSIWRVKSGDFQCVALFEWQADPLEQMKDILAIIHPTKGLFKCRLGLVDYADIGPAVVSIFRKEHKVPIIGKEFGSSNGTKSKKNWKNEMYDFFEVKLQSKLAHFPDMLKLKDLALKCSEDMLIQIENFQTAHWEWGILQRKGRHGRNYIIEAPVNKEENEDGQMEVSHDDYPSSSILGAYAAAHIEELTKELDKTDDLATEFKMFEVVTGPATSATYFGAAGGNGYRTQGQNPVARRGMEQASMPSTPVPMGEDLGRNDASMKLSALLDGILGDNKNH